MLQGVNHSIRRSNIICAALNLHITLRYVNTKDNLADPISRGETGASDNVLPPVLLPEELSPFLSYVS